MLRSMTAFARVDASGDGWWLGMELKSVNNRYCDVHVRMPRWMGSMEEQIKRRVKAALMRGRIDLFVEYRGKGGLKTVFEPDVELGKAYVSAIRKLALELDIFDNIDVSMILGNVKDVIAVSEGHEDTSILFERVAPHLDTLIQQAIEMGLSEGERLEQEIVSRLGKIESMLHDISRQSGRNRERSLVRLRERIDRYLDNIPVDDARLAQEAAILIDRMDITEEQVRAESHVQQFRRFLAETCPVGRKLDFLLQELFREVNTMSSKASDEDISQNVVGIKAELEKIREQVQNIV